MRLQVRGAPGVVLPDAIDTALLHTLSEVGGGIQCRTKSDVPHKTSLQKTWAERMDLNGTTGRSSVAPKHQYECRRCMVMKPDRSHRIMLACLAVHEYQTHLPTHAHVPMPMQLGRVSELEHLLGQGSGLPYDGEAGPSRHTPQHMGVTSSAHAPHAANAVLALHAVELHEVSRMLEASGRLHACALLAACTGRAEDALALWAGLACSIKQVRTMHGHAAASR